MADDNSVLLERMDGKLQRILDAQKRQGEDIAEVRQVQGQQRDKLAELTGLNIQERFVGLGRDVTELQLALKNIELHQASQKGERKGVEISAKVIYAFIAIGGVGILTVVGRILTTGGI